MKKVAMNLVGLDGNAYSILGAFQVEARKQDWNEQEIETVYNEAMSGDYDNLLRTMMKYVTELDSNDINIS